MKSYLFLVAFIFVLVACGGSGPQAQLQNGTVWTLVTVETSEVTECGALLRAEDGKLYRPVNSSPTICPTNKFYLKFRSVEDGPSACMSGNPIYIEEAKCS